ncbi:MAG: 50S ribosomal protein L4 [Clostridia bacterium]|nr:50S ribosomal protein L4 [Clostridia bacterium]
MLSCNNIPNVKTTQSTTLNVYDILNAEKLVMTVDAVKKLEEVYA